MKPLARVMEETGTTLERLVEATLLEALRRKRHRDDRVRVPGDGLRQCFTQRARERQPPTVLQGVDQRCHRVAIGEGRIDAVEARRSGEARAA